MYLCLTHLEYSQASMPRLCHLQYENQRKAWTDLSRDACRCRRHVLKLATIDPVAIGLTGQTGQKERTEFRERRVKGREQTQT